MTIRTDSQLDQQILDTIEADRAQLDRFAITPDRQLLGALVAPAATSAGFWSLATTKILTFAAAAAVIGSTIYFTSRPTAPVITPHDAVSTAAPSQPAAQQHSTSTVEQSIATRHRDVPARRPVVYEAPLVNAASASTKTPDIDHWNTGEPQQVQLPTKLEIETKAKQ